MNRILDRILASLVSALLSAGILTPSLYPSFVLAETCDKWVAKMASVQGRVQALRVGERQWRPVKLNDTFCLGDRIRILKLSRADIILSNQAILRLDQNTTVIFSELEKGKTLWVSLLNGAAYFFSRIPRSLRVFTPFVNAIVEGTEFYVRVESDKTFLSIFEGQVAAMNQAGAITLTRGQSAVVEGDRVPALYIVVRPRDAVQWALYYPPTLYYRAADFQAGPPGDWQTMVRKSIEFYMEGDLENAFESISEVPENISDPRFFIYRASLLLSVGRVDEAEADIEKALKLMPNGSQALAIQSVIAVVKNDKERGLSLAKKAVEMDSHSAAARIALSYALQANFNLRQALNSLKEAIRFQPESALAWARLAELRLSFGELNKTLKTADKAVALNPHLARTQTVLGFAYLSQIKTKLAKQSFQRAIEIDQADPLPRLGLGLAKIREGDLAEGRGEIEIASSLDPNNSLIRSYLGKAYYEEKKDKLASNQFAMAKELDPSDPTPFFYDAILKQSLNQPVEALKDLQKSILLNDNRAIYRSQLLLDADLAARSASLARIYGDLGFQQLSLAEGWKSVNTDPANFSAHRFLADSYSALPRHEIARVSELLQSQLLQPININPVQPRLAESNLYILSGAGPSNLSSNEFNPLFDRNRLALQASGVAGEHGTLGEEIVQSAIWKGFSYSLGQFHYETDGFRKNNDLKENIYDIFSQMNLSYQTSIQTEFRCSNTKKGDLTLRFFPDDFLPNLRDETKTNLMRIGLHHAFVPGLDLISSLMVQDSKTVTRDLPFPDLAVKFKTDSDNYSGEAQLLSRSEHLNITSGVGHFYIDQKDINITELLIFPPPTIEIIESHIKHTNLYLYSQIKYLKPLILTIGASADFLHGAIVDRNQFNPKLGIMWTPFIGTTLRGALFRTLKRTLITNQTLEPTQVAGFNQFFDDTEGTESWRYGVAIDQKFYSNIYGGVEFSKRDLEVPYEYFQPPEPSVVRKVDWEERSGRAYLYWTPHQWLALSAEYQYEELERGKQFTANTAEYVKTHRLPFGINFSHPIGLSANLKVTYIHQRGKFQPQGSEVNIPGESDFGVVDAALSYRLPKRYGILSLEAKNLFDKSFRYQDTDPVSPTIQPRRLVLFKFTLSF
jgi:tetratricopeptide (TPR) repeat protein